MEKFSECLNDHVSKDNLIRSKLRKIFYITIIMDHSSFILVVPKSFFDTPHPHCKNHDGTWHHERGEHAVGCHCIEDYAQCRRIVQFLTLDGKLRIKKNIKILFSQVVASFPRAVGTNFSTMMTNMVYPIFDRKFSQKQEFLKRKYPESAKKANTIKTEVDCITYGTDCVIALDRLNDTIQKFYRVFSILNKDSSNHLQTATIGDHSRFMGTLLANLNFQLGDDQGDISSFELKEDMERMLATIMPSSEMSLTELIALLGYSDVSGEMFQIGAESHPMSNDSSTNCTAEKISTEESSIISRLPELKGLQEMSKIKDDCDWNQYMQRWISYLEYLFHGSSIGSLNCSSGELVNYIWLETIRHIY